MNNCRCTHSECHFINGKYICSTCNKLIATKSTAQSWECHRCHKIHSPYSLTCDCNIGVTSANTTQVQINKMKTFELVTKNNQEGIKCLLCGLTSFYPHDIKNKFCGSCHLFHEDQGSYITNIMKHGD